MPSDPLVAAGGVPWRRDDGVLRVAVVHRPRYDDWSFPKGKLRYGELPLLAAVREVAEETGLSVVVGRRLPQTSYLSVDGPKTVHYWSMQSTGAFLANDETDALEWLTPEQAVGRLSYADDQELMADLLAVPVQPVRLLLVRHARAGDSSQWYGPDQERPLDDRGLAEAEALAEVLPAFCPARVRSADPLRCRQTVQPLADRLGLPVAPGAEFGEDAYADDPDTARAAISGMLDAESVTAISSQGGVIPDLLEWLLTSQTRVTGVSPHRRSEWPPSRKGSVWALTGHGGQGGRVVSADYYPSFLYPSFLP